MSLNLPPSPSSCIKPKSLLVTLSLVQNSSCIPRCLPHWSLFSFLPDSGSDWCLAFLSGYYPCPDPDSFFIKPVTTLETLRMGELGGSVGQVELRLADLVRNACSYKRVFRKSWEDRKVHSLYRFNAYFVTSSTFPVLKDYGWAVMSCPWPCDGPVFTVCPHRRHLWPHPTGSGGQGEPVLADLAAR